MIFEDFKNKYNGKGIDYDGYYGFQCMDLAHQYATEVVGHDFAPAPAAKDVWNQNIDGYDKIANSPTGVPQKGDIVIWGTAIGAYGHIAIFDNGDANSFTSFDQNWPLGSLCHLQQHNYTGVLGWFHPKVTQSDLSTELEELRKARDDNWNLYQAEIAKYNEVVSQLEVLKSDLNTKDTSIADLTQKLQECENIPPQIVEKIVEVPVEKLVYTEKIIDKTGFRKLSFFQKFSLLFG